MPRQLQSRITTQKSLDNNKMKCKKFFDNLLDLCNKNNEPPSVKIGVKDLIQNLIDDRIMPEEFCDKLERLLDAKPQPAIVGFLKENLPTLRRSLYTKELTIEGINPPTFIKLPTPARSFEAKLGYVIFQKGPSEAMNTTLMLPRICLKKTNDTMNAITVPINSIQTIPTVQLHNNLALKAKVCPQTVTDNKMEGLDDINDVPAMGGVNLAEETQNILNSNDMLGTPNRSCTDEYFIPRNVMMSRIKAVSEKHGLEMPSANVADIMSHAVRDRMKSVLEKLAVIARHRIDTSIKNDNRYEITQNVGSQLKFLKDVDMAMIKKKENFEKEFFLKRTSRKDPEFCELREKVKEKQRAELEEIRRHDANMTALQAIGPSKKRRIEGSSGEGSSASGSNESGSCIGRNLSSKPRVTRVTLRDMICYLEQEKETAHSIMLYRSCLK